MKYLIKDLKNYQKSNFPIKEVSDYIANKNITLDSVKKYSFFNKNCYTRNGIYRDKNFEILLICWSPNQTAPMHGHEGEKCWFKVLNGSLEICNYKLNSREPLRLTEIKKINANRGYLDGPADIHSINCLNNHAVTLHVYAKPYDSCEIYDLTKNKIKIKKMNYYSINGKIC